MYCPLCGKQIPEDSKFCPSCGKQVSVVQTNYNYVQHHYVPSQYGDVMPENHLTKSIFAILLFMICGIPAIVNSAKVERLWTTGNKKAAIEASSKANSWGTAGIILGVLSWVGSIASMAAMF